MGDADDAENDSGHVVDVVRVHNPLLSHSFIATKHTAFQQDAAVSEAGDEELSTSEYAQTDPTLQFVLQGLVNLLRPADVVRFLTTLHTADSIVRQTLSTSMSAISLLDFVNLEDLEDQEGKEDSRYGLYLALVSNRHTGVEEAAVMIIQHDRTRLGTGRNSVQWGVRKHVFDQNGGEIRAGSVYAERRMSATHRNSSKTSASIRTDGDEGEGDTDEGSMPDGNEKTVTAGKSLSGKQGRSSRKGATTTTTTTTKGGTTKKKKSSKKKRGTDTEDDIPTDIAARIIAERAREIPLKMLKVMPVYSDLLIRLIGGGMVRLTSRDDSLQVATVSVRSMWGMVASLQRAREIAKEHNLYPRGPSHQWVPAYLKLTQLNDEHRNAAAEDDIDEDDVILEYTGYNSDADDSSDEDLLELEGRPSKREVIAEIRKVMLSCADPDLLTAAQIIASLKEKFGNDIVGPKGYSKAFIDERILRLYGQLEPPTEIVDNLYLGTEFNASNKTELEELGIALIVNITEEVECFFPMLFHYHRIRVVDRPNTDLTEYLQPTIELIERYLENGYAVLVHCQRGVSRSASIVIAYLMSHDNMSYDEAFALVKSKRSIIKPNAGFVKQLKRFEQKLK